MKSSDGENTGSEPPEPSKGSAVGNVYPIDGVGDFAGGPPGGGGGMELERRLRELEVRVAELVGVFNTALPNLATKAEVKDAVNAMTKWTAAIVLASTAIVVSVVLGT